MSNQAEKGHGRKLRRARNIVKKWQAENTRNDGLHCVPIGMEIPAYCDIQQAARRGRYERALALLLADKLQAS
jgi:hypothetical protein